MKLFSIFHCGRAIEKNSPSDLPLCCQVPNCSVLTYRLSYSFEEISQSLRYHLFEAIHDLYILKRTKTRYYLYFQVQNFLQVFFAEIFAGVFVAKENVLTKMICKRSYLNLTACSHPSKTCSLKLGISRHIARSRVVALTVLIFLDLVKLANLCLSFSYHHVEEVVKKNLSAQIAEEFASASSLISFDLLHIIWGTSSPQVPCHKLMLFFHLLKLHAFLYLLSTVLFLEQIYGSQLFATGSERIGTFSVEQIESQTEHRSDVPLIRQLHSFDVSPLSFSLLSSPSLLFQWNLKNALALEQPQHCFWAQFTFMTNLPLSSEEQDETPVFNSCLRFALQWWSQQRCCEV